MFLLEISNDLEIIYHHGNGHIGVHGCLKVNNFWSFVFILKTRSFILLNAIVPKYGIKMEHCLTTRTRR